MRLPSASLTPLTCTAKELSEVSHGAQACRSLGSGAAHTLRVPPGVFRHLHATQRPLWQWAQVVSATLHQVGQSHHGWKEPSSAHATAQRAHGKLENFYPGDQHKSWPSQGRPRTPLQTTSHHSWSCESICRARTLHPSSLAIIRVASLRYPPAHP
jgi:hypothetical protein